MSKILASIQPAYLPWLPYFKRIELADVFIILDNVQFVKNSFHNRNYITSNDQLIRLTVPVIHKFGQKIFEVKIDNSKNWREKHWKSILQSYSKTKYFNLIKKFEKFWKIFVKKKNLKQYFHLLIYVEIMLQ